MRFVLVEVFGYHDSWVLFMECSTADQTCDSCLKRHAISDRGKSSRMPLGLPTPYRDRFPELFRRDADLELYRRTHLFAWITPSFSDIMTAWTLEAWKSGKNASTRSGRALTTKT